MQKIITPLQVYKGKIIFLVLVFLTCFSRLLAQEYKPFLNFTSQKEKNANFIITQNNNEINVLTNSGFIEIYANNALYNTNDFELVVGYKDRQKRTLNYNNANQGIYLNPDDSYIISLYQVNPSKKLIYNFTIKRPKLIPQLKIKVNNIAQSATPNQSFSVNAKDKIEFELIKNPYFNNLEVDYKIKNLKTKSILRGQMNKDLSDLIFESNTDYELTFNYNLQKESSSTYYIQVNPKWYQVATNFLKLISSIGLVIIMMIIYFYKKKISRTQDEKDKLFQASLRLQSLLNPHFTFNALSTIQGLINKNCIDEANIYLQEFSALLRKSLSNNEKVYNNLAEELQIMEWYIKLEALRFNFDWRIEIENELPISDLEIPTFLIQPLIENAIKHGLSNSNQNAQLIINVNYGLTKNDLCIKIIDNGKWINHEKNEGFGLSLTQDRIATINKLDKSRSISLNFDKSIGTTALLNFKNWIDD